MLLAWLPILFVALIAVPAVLRLDARAAPFKSFRERMASFRGRR
jgi:hypothetical protein